MDIQRVSMTHPRYTVGRPGPVRMVVLHATAGRYPNDGADLQAGGTIKRPVSVQYYINPSGHITQFVSDADTAWHAGKSTWLVDGERIPYDIGCNAVSIGIEISNPNTGHDLYPSVQYASTLGLVKHLVDRYDIPQSQLVRHLDIAPNHKTDPAGFPWSAFVAEVYAQPTLLPLGQYRVKDHIDYAQIRQGRGVRFPEATINGVSARIQPGVWISIDDIQNGWAHLTSGLGFVALSLLERMPTDTEALTFLHPPRISRTTFIRILVAARSPAAPDGGAMYDGIAGVGVDPAIGLAFFQHESSFGKAGICKTYGTNNLGNVRRPLNPARAKLILTRSGPFAAYRTWALGAIDWAERMKVRYADPTNSDSTFPTPLDTVERATPIYAPVGDGNDPSAYARAVRAAVDGWMREERQQ